VQETDQPDPTGNADASASASPAQTPRAAPPTSPGKIGSTRTTWPQVLGIISIVLGVLGCLSNAWQVLSAFYYNTFMGFLRVGSGPGLASFDATQTAMHALRIPIAFFAGLALLSSGLFVWAGIATLRRTRLGPTLHVTSAILRILAGIGSTYVSFIVQSRVAAAMSAPGAAPMAAAAKNAMEVAQIIGVLLWLVVTVSYPTFILIWFFRRVIRAETQRWS
jgi:hypothetical protein